MGKCDDNGDVRKVAVAFCCVFSSRYLNLCSFSCASPQIRTGSKVLFCISICAPDLVFAKTKRNISRQPLYLRMYLRYANTTANTESKVPPKFCICTCICHAQIQVQIQKSGSLYLHAKCCICMQIQAWPAYLLANTSLGSVFASVFAHQILYLRMYICTCIYI